MNRKNLDIVLQHYIDHFEELDDVNNHDEGYKWRVESAFKQYWEIDAEDFPHMFRNSMSEISKTNLINNSRIQPISGISKLLENDEDVEFVREQFRSLFSEDQGDLDARGERVGSFLEAVNARIEERLPGSWKSMQQRNTVIYYLNLWKPEDNYIFKATEANEWADCIEYADDFGSGASFSLKKYYKMCDELNEALNDYPDLLEKNQKRITREAKGFDDHNHILVFDVIYCSSSKYMNFYIDCPTLGVSTKERVTIARRKEEIRYLEEEIASINEKTNKLNSELKEVPNIEGQRVQHKKYGKGIVVGSVGDKFDVDFSGRITKFTQSSIAQGFVAFSDNTINEILIYNYKIEKKISEYDKELKKMNRELESLE